jgi:hypothetical protein
MDTARAAARVGDGRQIRDPDSEIPRWLHARHYCKPQVWSSSSRGIGLTAENILLRTLNEDDPPITILREADGSVVVRAPKATTDVAPACVATDRGGSRGRVERGRDPTQLSGLVTRPTDRLNSAPPVLVLTGCGSRTDKDSCEGANAQVASWSQDILSPCSSSTRVAGRRVRVSCRITVRQTSQASRSSCGRRR